MKNLLLASAAVLALSAFGASAAKASDVNAVIDLSGVAQVQSAAVKQAAVSADVAVGNVQGSTLNSTAANLNNDVTQSVTNDVGADGVLGNGALDLTDISQKSTAPVDQLAVSIVGSGGLNASNVTSLAANLNNVATQTVSVTVKP